jgi:hypothetical protein
MTERPYEALQNNPAAQLRINAYLLHCLTQDSDAIGNLQRGLNRAPTPKSREEVSDRFQRILGDARDYFALNLNTLPALQTQNVTADLAAARRTLIHTREIMEEEIVPPPHVNGQKFHGREFYSSLIQREFFADRKGLTPAPEEPKIGVVSVLNHVLQGKSDSVMKLVNVNKPDQTSAIGEDDTIGKLIRNQQQPRAR